MQPRRFPRPSGLAAAIAIASSCAVAPLAAQTTPPAAPAAPSSAQPAAATAPVSATSQCVEGPGAPPADPTKVTRVVPGQSTTSSPATPAAPEDSSAPAEVDDPSKPAPVLLEIGANVGLSVRFDDPPIFTTTRRVGAVVGGSLSVWTSRALALGLAYSHADLSRSETPPLSVDTISVDHRAHAFTAEARVAPFRFSSLSLFALIGGGLVWQEASLRATFPPRDGAPGGSFSCDVGSGAEFGFRAGIGAKAHLGGSFSFTADASFFGYRFSSGVQGDCAPGAGTAQTLMVRAGLAYDIDVSRFVR